MSYKTRIISGMITTVISITLMIVGFFYMSTMMLIIGVIILLVSIFYMILTMSMQIFVKDKEIDIESLKKQGLTIVKCLKCNRNNVLEDKFCIFCGEKLGEENEEVQK